MNERKYTAILIGFVLSVSLIAASLTAVCFIYYDSRAHMQILGEVCEGIIEKQPEAGEAIGKTLKEYQFKSKLPSYDNDFLLSYGYHPGDFFHSAQRYSRLFILAGFLAGGALFLITLIYCRKKKLSRIKFLTDYLEKVNTGDCDVLFQAAEDDFSKLQDEIYKTVTALHKTRDGAVHAKNNFADNLYNIAHQIKTPITSISLSVQMLRKHPSALYLDQIMRQLSQLTHLEEALLLLSRIDAGTLPLEKKEADVFTILMLAADNLQELFLKANVSVDIPELGESLIKADVNWTMEAIINLFKNCIEHTPRGGAVHCAYEQNPLYTQIQIWDTGPGFLREDIPHLFERFYRGQNNSGGGIGIGLSLSKAIIESQNGTIRAKNLAGNGACFEIRFYSH